MREIGLLDLRHECFNNDTYDVWETDYWEEINNSKMYLSVFFLNYAAYWLSCFDDWKTMAK